MSSGFRGWTSRWSRLGRPAAARGRYVANSDGPRSPGGPTVGTVDDQRGHTARQVSVRRWAIYFLSRPGPAHAAGMSVGLTSRQTAGRGPCFSPPDAIHGAGHGPLGCRHGARRPGMKAGSGEDARARLVAAAGRHVGRTFHGDCSGFVRRVYAEAGVPLRLRSPGHTGTGGDRPEPGSGESATCRRPGVFSRYVQS